MPKGKRADKNLNNSNDAEHRKETDTSDIFAEIKIEVLKDAKGGAGFNVDMVEQATADLGSVKAKLRRETIGASCPRNTSCDGESTCPPRCHDRIFLP